MSDFRFARPDHPRRAVLLAGAALVGAGLIVAWAAASGARTTLTDIVALQETVARAEAQRDVSAGERSGASAEALFYAGDTPQLAQAALQTDLQALAEAHDIAVEVMRADQIEQVDGLVRLNLSMTATVPEAQLGTFLQAVAARSPILVVEDVNLRRARATRRNDDRRVAMQMQLFGVLRR